MSLEPEVMLAFRKHLLSYEGWKPKVYTDDITKKSIPTVGVGLNLTQEWVRRAIKSLGIDVEAVKSGRRPLEDAEIEMLFRISIDQAVKDARSLFPNFSSLTPGRQVVLLDMALQMGHPRLEKFSEFVKAVNAGDWERASREILTTTKDDGSIVPTPYSQDTPGRANNNAEAMRTGDYPKLGLDPAHEQRAHLSDDGEPLSPLVVAMHQNYFWGSPPYPSTPTQGRFLFDNKGRFRPSIAIGANGEVHVDAHSRAGGHVQVDAHTRRWPS